MTEQAFTAPLIDNSALPKPLLATLSDPISINVNINGNPRPSVRWQIGRKRVKESPKYHLEEDGKSRYTLVVAMVTEDLNDGVWVMATNEAGEDCCLIDVKTSQGKSSQGDGKKSKGGSSAVRLLSLNDSGSQDEGNVSKMSRKKRVRKIGDHQSVTSLDTWTGTGEPSPTTQSSMQQSFDDVTGESSAGVGQPRPAPRLNLDRSYDCAPGTARQSSRRSRPITTSKPLLKRDVSADAVLIASREKDRKSRGSITGRPPPSVRSSALHVTDFDVADPATVQAASIVQSAPKDSDGAAGESLKRMKRQNATLADVDVHPTPAPRTSLLRTDRPVSNEGVQPGASSTGESQEESEIPAWARPPRLSKSSNKRLNMSTDAVFFRGDDLKPEKQASATNNETPAASQDGNFVRKVVRSSRSSTRTKKKGATGQRASSVSSFAGENDRGSLMSLPAETGHTRKIFDPPSSNRTSAAILVTDFDTATPPATPRDELKTEKKTSRDGDSDSLKAAGSGKSDSVRRRKVSASKLAPPENQNISPKVGYDMGQKTSLDIHENISNTAQKPKTEKDDMRSKQSANRRSLESQTVNESDKQISACLGVDENSNYQEDANERTWELFGMKLSALCKSLMNSYDDETRDSSLNVQKSPHIQDEQHFSEVKSPKSVNVPLKVDAFGVPSNANKVVLQSDNNLILPVSNSADVNDVMQLKKHADVSSLGGKIKPKVKDKKPRVTTQDLDNPEQIATAKTEHIQQEDDSKIIVELRSAEQRKSKVIHRKSKESSETEIRSSVDNDDDVVKTTSANSEKSTQQPSDICNDADESERSKRNSSPIDSKTAPAKALKDLSPKTSGSNAGKEPSPLNNNYVELRNSNVLPEKLDALRLSLLSMPSRTSTEESDEMKRIEDDDDDKGNDEVDWPVLPSQHLLEQQAHLELEKQQKLLQEQQEERKLLQQKYEQQQLEQLQRQHQEQLEQKQLLIQQQQNMIEEQTREQQRLQQKQLDEQKRLQQQHELLERQRQQQLEQQEQQLQKQRQQQQKLEEQLRQQQKQQQEREEQLKWQQQQLEEQRLQQQKQQEQLEIQQRMQQQQLEEQQRKQRERQQKQQQRQLEEQQRLKQRPLEEEEQQQRYQLQQLEEQKQKQQQEEQRQTKQQEHEQKQKQQQEVEKLRQRQQEELLLQEKKQQQQQKQQESVNRLQGSTGEPIADKNKTESLTSANRATDETEDSDKEWEDDDDEEEEVEEENEKDEEKKRMKEKDTLVSIENHQSVNIVPIVSSEQSFGRTSNVDNKSPPHQKPQIPPRPIVSSKPTAQPTATIIPSRVAPKPPTAAEKLVIQTASKTSEKPPSDALSKQNEITIQSPTATFETPLQSGLLRSNRSNSVEVENNQSMGKNATDECLENTDDFPAIDDSDEESNDIDASGLQGSDLSPVSSGGMSGGTIARDIETSRERRARFLDTVKNEPILKGILLPTTPPRPPLVGKARGKSDVLFVSTDKDRSAGDGLPGNGEGQWEVIVRKKIPDKDAAASENDSTGRKSPRLSGVAVPASEMLKNSEDGAAKQWHNLDRSVTGSVSKPSSVLLVRTSDSKEPAKSAQGIQANAPNIIKSSKPPPPEKLAVDASAPNEPQVELRPRGNAAQITPRDKDIRSSQGYTLVDINIDSSLSPTKLPSSSSVSPSSSLQRRERPASYSPFSASFDSPSGVKSTPSIVRYPQIHRRLSGGLKPARSEEFLYRRDMTPTPPPDDSPRKRDAPERNSARSSLRGEVKGRMRPALSMDYLNRSSTGSDDGEWGSRPSSSFSQSGMCRRSLSREHIVVTESTREEIEILRKPSPTPVKSEKPEKSIKQIDVSSGAKISGNASVPLYVKTLKTTVAPPKPVAMLKPVPPSKPPISVKPAVGVQTNNGTAENNAVSKNIIPSTIRSKGQEISTQTEMPKIPPPVPRPSIPVTIDQTQSKMFIKPPPPIKPSSGPSTSAQTDKKPASTIKKPTSTPFATQTDPLPAPSKLTPASVNNTMVPKPIAPSKVDSLTKPSVSTTNRIEAEPTAAQTDDKSQRKDAPVLAVTKTVTKNVRPAATPIATQTEVFHKPVHNPASSMVLKVYAEQQKTPVVTPTVVKKAAVPIATQTETPPTVKPSDSQPARSTSTISPPQKPDSVPSSFPVPSSSSSAMSQGASQASAFKIQSKPEPPNQKSSVSSSTMTEDLRFPTAAETDASLQPQLQTSTSVSASAEMEKPPPVTDVKIQPTLNSQSQRPLSVTSSTMTESPHSPPVTKSSSIPHSPPQKRLSVSIATMTEVYHSMPPQLPEKELEPQPSSTRSLSVSTATMTDNVLPVGITKPAEPSRLSSPDSALETILPTVSKAVSPIHNVNQQNTDVFESVHATIPETSDLPAAHSAQPTTPSVKAQSNSFEKLEDVPRMAEVVQETKMQQFETQLSLPAPSQSVEHTNTVSNIVLYEYGEITRFRRVDDNNEEEPWVEQPVHGPPDPDQIGPTHHYQMDPVVARLLAESQERRMFLEEERKRRASEEMTDQQLLQNSKNKVMKNGSDDKGLEKIDEVKSKSEPLASPLSTGAASVKLPEERTERDNKGYSAGINVKERETSVDSDSDDDGNNDNHGMPGVSRTVLMTAQARSDESTLPIARCTISPEQIVLQPIEDTSDRTSHKHENDGCNDEPKDKDNTTRDGTDSGDEYQREIEAAIEASRQESLSQRHPERFPEDFPNAFSAVQPDEQFHLPSNERSNEAADYDKDSTLSLPPEPRNSPRRGGAENDIDDVTAEKAYVQTLLGSLGTVVFMVLAAIIYHFLNRIVGDDLE